MQENHQWWDVDKKDEIHQKQHPMTSASYERLDPNKDNPCAMRYSLRTCTQQTMWST
jgi:hypothetical protein